MASKEKNPETLKALVDSLNSKCDEYKKYRAPYERPWYENMAFSIGRHWTEWVENMNRLMEYPSPTHRVKLTVNICFAIWRILLAKILRIEPTLFVLPGTGDTESQEAADIGFKFLQYLWRVNKMDQNQERFTSRGIVYGSAFFMPFFNQRKGEPFSKERFFEEDGPNRIPWIPKGEFKQATNLTGKPLWVEVKDGKTVMDHYRTGEADVDIVDPLEIFPCKEAKDDPESLTDFFRERIVTAEFIKDLFGVDVKPTHDYQTNSINDQIGNLLKTEGGEVTKPKNSVLFREWFRAPCNEYPKGRYVALVKGFDVPLENEDLPAECLKMPYPNLPLIKWDFWKVPGRFWGMSVMEQIIPLQVQYNKAVSRVIEHVNLMAKGKWVVPDQAKLDVLPTDEPAQIIRYFAGAWPAPSQAALANLPAYVFENINMLMQGIYDISGIHEVSHSRTPRGVRSGKAIQALQEMDDTSLGPSIKSYGSALQELGMFWMHIGKEHYTEKRMVVVIGKNFKDYIPDFNSSMLESNAEVICQMGSELPQSLLARQELYMELYKGGAIDKTKLIDLLGMADDSLKNPDRLDETKASLENDRILKGEVVTIGPSDNPMLHLPSHNAIRKQPNWDQQPKQIQHVMMLHIMAHVEQIQNPNALTPDVKIAVQAKIQAALPTLPKKGKG